MQMASYKRIFALILIAALISTSSAARGGKQIVPEGNIRVLDGKGTLTASIAGVTVPNERVALTELISEPPKLFGRFNHVETFRTPENQIISQVRVTDVAGEMYTPGGHIELNNNGPGFKNVTLKFFSSWNSGIRKNVILYVHH